MSAAAILVGATSLANLAHRTRSAAVHVRFVATADGVRARADQAPILHAHLRRAAAAAVERAAAPVIDGAALVRLACQWRAAANPLDTVAATPLRSHALATVQFAAAAVVQRSALASRRRARRPNAAVRVNPHLGVIFGRRASGIAPSGVEHASIHARVLFACERECAPGQCQHQHDREQEAIRAPWLRSPRVCHRSPSSDPANMSPPASALAQGATRICALGASPVFVSATASQVIAAAVATAALTQPTSATIA